MKFYVYRHIRLDKNEPFYIGIGTKPLIFNTFKQEYNRAFSADGRNAAWLDIVIKSDYKVEIIFESNDYQEVKNKEYEFIQTYKNFVRDFKSMREAINTLKISSRILKQILNGVRPSFEGNIFKYKI